MEKKIKITQFLNEDGRIAQLPQKHAVRCAVLEYLAESFDTDTDYTEKQVNEIIDSRHTFNDLYLLRRELVDNGFLDRERDGSRYRRIISPQPTNKE